MQLRIHHFLPLVLILAVCLSGGEAPAADGPGLQAAAPRWPLDLPTRYLTSNFMEFRQGRYHAGLDLKTRSQTGFPVFAVQDGSIVRVRATARAYGRAVYLQGAGGQTYVFAHLERFNDRIRAKVEAAQARSGTYRTELSFKPGELPVKRGEVLGLTGQSGTGGPHLHFEVRDAQQRPLNPQDHGFAVDDTIAPLILGVRAIPAGCRATVFGTAAEHLAEDPQLGGLSGTLDTLRICGLVAFSARVIDHADIRRHILEPYRLEVTLDREMVYREENRSFAFGQNSRQTLEWFTGGGVRERWLYRRPGVDLPGRAGGPWHLGASGQGLSPGIHLLEIEVADRAGSTASVSIPILVAADPNAAVAAPLAAGSWRQAGFPVGSATTEGCTLSPFCDDCGHSLGMTGRRLDPARGDPVLEAVTLWSRPWAPDSLAVERARRQGLELVGYGTEFLAAEWPAESAVEVEFLGDPAPGGPGAIAALGNDPTVGVYRWDGDDWSLAGLLRADSGRAGPVFGLGRPGPHAVLADRTPPRILKPSAQELAIGPGPESTVPGVTMPFWEVLVLPLAEEGSGLAEQALTVRLDGVPLIVEPDLPRSRLLVELPAGLAPGPHRLAVGVADAAGNSASADFEFSCSRRSPN